MKDLECFYGPFYELCKKNGIEIGEKIGSGGCGCVYEGTLTKPFPNDLSGSIQCAVKLTDYNEKNKKYVDQEINTQICLDHPNIVRVFAHYVKKREHTQTNILFLFI